MIYREYYILLLILNYCFEKGVYDDLPALLGEMSVDIFDDFMPVDMMVHDDWREISQNIKSYGDLKCLIVSLLENYEHKYHFNFEDTKRIVAELTDTELAMIINTEGQSHH